MEEPETLQRNNGIPQNKRHPLRQRIVRTCNIQNTLVYTHLVNWDTDDFICKVAKTTDEAVKLVESGFDYVTEMDHIKLFRKWKTFPNISCSSYKLILEKTGNSTINF
jgi:hypothetical protein